MPESFEAILAAAEAAADRAEMLELKDRLQALEAANGDWAGLERQAADFEAMLARARRLAAFQRVSKVPFTLDGWVEHQAAVLGLNRRVEELLNHQTARLSAGPQEENHDQPGR